MGLARREAGADDLAVIIHDQLGLEGMAFLFPAIELFLLFLGLSIGVSVASSNMNWYSKSLCSSLRLLGRLNLPDLTKMFSSLLMTRFIVGSLTP